MFNKDSSAEELVHAIVIWVEARPGLDFCKGNYSNENSKADSGTSCFEKGFIFVFASIYRTYFNVQYLAWLRMRILVVDISPRNIGNISPNLKYSSMLSLATVKNILHTELSFSLMEEDVRDKLTVKD